MIALFSLLFANTDLVAARDDIEEIEEVAVVTEEDSWYGHAFPEMDRNFGLLNAHTARPGTILFIVTHRTRRGVLRDPFYDYLGFDGGGLKVGINLRLGLARGLDIGLARLNGTAEPFDTYEFDLRYRFLNEKDHLLNAAVRVGGTWFADDGNQALAYFGQLLIDKLINNRILISAAVMHHSDSSGDQKMDTDSNPSTAFGVGLDMRLSPSLAIDFEITNTLAGFKQRYPAFTIGPKIITNRHTFAVVLSNTQYTLADGLVANSRRELNQVILGFNITREL